jgi:hypothetical protein
MAQNGVMSDIPKQALTHNFRVEGQPPTREFSVIDCRRQTGDTLVYFANYLGVGTGAGGEAIDLGGRPFAWFPGLRFGFRNGVFPSWFLSGWRLSPLFHEDGQIFIFPALISCLGEQYCPQLAVTARLSNCAFLATNVH